VERKYSTSLLTATGTAVSLRRCAALVTGGLIAVAVAPVLMYHGDATWGVSLFVGGGIVLLGSVFYALRRTACPRSDLPWLQYALGEKSVNGWLTWLTSFTECPECKFSVKDDASSWLSHSND
jgi:hypothetical protein